MNPLAKLKFQTRILLGFVAIIAVFALLVLTAVLSIQRLVNINRDLDESMVLMREISRLRADNTRVRTLLLEAVNPDLPDHEVFLREVEENMLRMADELNAIAEVASEDEQASAIFEEMLVLAGESHDLRATQVALIRQARFQEAETLFRGRSYQAYEQVHQLSAKLEAYLGGINQALQEEAERVADRSVRLYSYLSILAVLIIVWIAISMVRMISRVARELRDGVNVLGSSSAEIQTTVAEISTGAAETATAISETTTTVEEIRQTSMVSASKAKNLLNSSQKASEIGERGLETSQAMVDAMQQIEVQMKTIYSTITQLAEKNRSIGEITSTVADIADQSNLLAVNAAIEAAKAGEHGRGFSVVAQEIRSLAEQSKKSTLQVKEILNEIQLNVNKAVEVIGQGNKTVDAGSQMVKEDREVVELLIQSIEEAMEAAVQISSSSQQQMAGMDQIVPAMDNIRLASEQNVSGIRQTQEAVQSLDKLGRDLKKVIDRYRL